jgi:predicted enzyme related to lactoylglutathione lyase
MGFLHDQNSESIIRTMGCLVKKPASATELGAKILMPAMDIPTVGRIAIFQDPQGATLGIFQPAKD